MARVPGSYTRRADEAILMRVSVLRLAADGTPYCRECGSLAVAVDELGEDWPGPGWRCDCGWSVTRGFASPGW